MNFTENANTLIDLRRWQEEHLPIYHSLISYDLALRILSLANEGERVGLKSLYRSMPNSEAQVRKKIRLFEKDGWVCVQNSSSDERNRAIVPTEKMLRAYENYFFLFPEIAKRVSL